VEELKNRLEVNDTAIQNNLAVSLDQLVEII
jgi:hypothetical protein